MGARWQLSGLGTDRIGGKIFWSGLEAVVSGLLSFLSAFTIARIIGPAELGIGAAVVAVHVLLWVGVNALFADALVQRAELAEHTADSAFWASAGCGGLAGLLQMVAGFELVHVLHDPRLQTMSIMLAMPLPLVGGAGAVQGMLTRARAYRALAERAVIGQGLGAVVGIAAAVMGAGAWALVLQQVCVSIAGALALLLRSRWRPQRICRWNEIRVLLRIGLPLTSSTLVQHGRYRIFVLLIGIMAGPAVLGQVHMAFRLVDTVRDLLMTALWRLLLPVMAEHQHDPPSLLACVDRCLVRASWILFPICALMALVMQPLVALLLGPVWTDASKSAQWLVGLMAYVFLGFPGGIAAIARGKPKYALFTNLAALFATLCAALLFYPTTPLQAVMVWVGAQVLTSPYGLAMNARLLRVGTFRPLHAGLPALAVSIACTFVGITLPELFGATFGTNSVANAWLIVERLVAGALVCLPLAFLTVRRYGCAREWWVRLTVGLLLLIIASPAIAQNFDTYFAEGVPGYDLGRGVTVKSRLRPLFEPPGVRAGAFMLHPVLEEAAGYDTNVLGSTRPSGSWGIATRPSLLAASDWAGQSLAGFLSMDDIRMVNLPVQSQINWTALLGGGFDIGRDRVTLAAAHLSLHQLSTDIDALPSDKPIAYQVNDVRAGYTFNLPRMSIMPAVDFSQYNYDATTILGVASPQAYRNRNVGQGGITLRYELAPGRNLVMVSRAINTSYTQPQIGSPSRNSNGYVMLAGIDYDYDGVWRLRLLLGWEVRDFAAAQYGVHSAPMIEGGVIWTPTGLTTVIATISQSIEDAAQEGIIGYTYTTAKLRLDHEYFRNILLHASGTVQRAVFSQGGGAQNGLGLGAGVTWMMNRNLRLSTDYAFMAQQGNPNAQLTSTGNYHSNSVLMTLRFAL